MFCSAPCVDVRRGQSERKRCDQILGNPCRFLGNPFLFVLMTLLLVNLYRNISLLFAKIYHLSFWQVVFNEKIWCLIGFYFQRTWNHVEIVRLYQKLWGNTLGPAYSE